VRVVVTITLSGDADGQSVYTDAGLNRMVKAVNETSRKLFRGWDFSDTDDGVDSGDTSIANRTFRNQVTVTASARDVEVRTNVTTDDTPDAEIPFDIVESGVIDDDEILVWGSPNATLTVAQNTEFVAEHTTRIV